MVRIDAVPHIEKLEKWIIEHFAKEFNASEATRGVGLHTRSGQVSTTKRRIEILYDYYKEYEPNGLTIEKMKRGGRIFYRMVRVK